MECSLKLPICFFWDSWVYGVQVWDFFDSPHDHDAWNRLLWKAWEGIRFGAFFRLDPQHRLAVGQLHAPFLCIQLYAPRRLTGDGLHSGFSIFFS
jgi:hypothetical protein